MAAAVLAVEGEKARLPGGVKGDEAGRAIDADPGALKEIEAREHRTHLVKNAVDAPLAKLNRRGLAGRGLVECTIVQMYSAPRYRIRDRLPVRADIPPELPVGEYYFAELLAEIRGDALCDFDIGADFEILALRRAAAVAGRKFLGLVERRPNFRIAHDTARAMSLKSPRPVGGTTTRTLRP